jgi:hypothetical protein
MAKLINSNGQPKLFTLEAAPITKGTATVKQLSIREPNDSTLGVYMYATLISEDPDKRHEVFGYFERGKRVRVTFEIMEDEPEHVDEPDADDA